MLTPYAFLSIVGLPRSKHPSLHQHQQLKPVGRSAAKRYASSRHGSFWIMIETFKANGGSSNLTGSPTDLTLETRPLPDYYVRPATETSFSIPFDVNLVVRPWQPRDRLATSKVIADCLVEHGLDWEPADADADAVNVDIHYKNGEFWIVEDIRNAQIVATAAFRPDPSRGDRVVEIRKMYLHPSVRNRGLGSFLLSALERRAVQLGFTSAVVETASPLSAAIALYEARGYSSISDVYTDRCDRALQKDLRHPVPPPMKGDVEIIDSSRGWTVGYASRTKIAAHRLLFRSVAVLVQTVDGRILVHRRSLQKKTFPGKWVALVTGCVDWGETPLETAKREVLEEVGIDNLTFSQPFDPFVSVDDGTDGGTGSRQGIMFHPFIATGMFSEDDVVCAPDEVECGRLLTRKEILRDNIGGSLWAEFRKHGL